MGIRTRTFEYKDGNTVLQAYMAWDETVSDSRPAVMVTHTFAGRTEFEESKAEMLAELGYVGVAIDLYGRGIRGETKEQNIALMQPLLQDRAMLQRRMKLALDHVRKQHEVDSSRVAAIGYCFGGLCVLDLARTGADVQGVVSFHGRVSKPGNTDGIGITSKVLVLHGWEDPMAPADQMLALTDELNEAGADWQIHAYGRTMHSFTNPAENSPELGIAYSAVADRRSWQSMQLFLAEIL